MSKSIVKTTAAACVPAEVQIAAQLQDQYRKAVAGTREVLVFGAMMMQLGASLELQIRHGGNHEGRTLKDWIETNCPSINYKTAHGFYTLAKGLREALEIPVTTDIHRLLTAAPADLSKREAKIRAEIDNAIAGKSARQLEFDFGIRKARAALPSLGGAREGAGRPARSLTREQEQAEAIFSEDTLGQIGVAVFEKRFHLRLGDEKKRVLLGIALALAEDLLDGELRAIAKNLRGRWQP